MVSLKKYLGFCFICLLVPRLGFSQTELQNDTRLAKSKNSLASGHSGIMLAKAAKSSAGSGRGAKMLKQEKSIKTKKGQASQSLDFEETSIGGERKTPLGSFISQTKSDKNFDFVKIRTNWHPEMIQSATMLEGQR